MALLFSFQVKKVSKKPLVAIMIISWIYFFHILLATVQSRGPFARPTIRADLIMATKKNTKKTSIFEVEEFYFIYFLLFCC